MFLNRVVMRGSEMLRRMVQTDLNLLKALHVLLEERNVTRAANHLFVSQSAISKSLRKLREVFGDPLLVRTSHGLIATARAEEIAPLVRDTIRSLETLLTLPSFEPSEMEGFMRIAGPEFFLMLALPNLILDLQTTAPKLSIESLHMMDDYLQRMANGEIDFAIYLDQAYPQGFTSIPIFPVEPQLWFHNRHPLNDKIHLDLSDICSYPMIAFHSPNISSEQLRNVWEAIEASGLSAHVIMTTSQPLVAFDLLSKSDAILMGPKFLSELPVLSKDIASRPLGHIESLSQAKYMQFNIALIQHERNAGSPPHRWLASKLTHAYSDLAMGDDII